MYIIAIITNLTTNFIDVIQKATTEKEVSLPFGVLISRVVIMAKISLHDNESIFKIYGKISIVTVIKSKDMVSKKKKHILKGLSHLNPKLLKPATPYSIL
jgi:hypothetical protein